MLARTLPLGHGFPHAGIIPLSASTATTIPDRPVRSNRKPMSEPRKASFANSSHKKKDLLCFVK